MAAPVTAQITWSPSESTRNVPGKYCSRAVFPAPLISMRSLLGLVEQARLRGEIGAPARPLNPRFDQWRFPADSRIHRAIPEVQGQQALGNRVRGARQGLAGPAGYASEAFRQGPVGMDQLGHLPKSSKLVGRPFDPVPEQLRPEPWGDR